MVIMVVAKRKYEILSKVARNHGIDDISHYFKTKNDLTNFGWFEICTIQNLQSGHTMSPYLRTYY